MPIRTALLGILPPIVIAAIVLLLGWRPWSAKPARWCGVASALALALAYAITDTLVGGGWPGMPPLDTHRWLPFLALAAALPVFLAPVSASGGRNWARFVLLNATAAIGLFLVLPAHHGDESLFHIALATLVVTVMVALTRMNLSVLGAGGGVRVRVGASQWAQLGYKYHHISNAGTAFANPGLDGNVLYAGYQWSVRLPQ